FAPRARLVAFSGERHSKMKAVRSAIGNLRNDLLQLLNGWSVQTLLVIDPAQGINEAGNVRVLLNYTLRERLSLVQIPLVVSRVNPRKIVRGNRPRFRVLVYRDGLSITLNRRVRVAATIFQHSNQNICASVIGIAVEYLAILCDGAVLLVCVSKERAQSGVSWHVVRIKLKSAAKLTFRKLSVLTDVENFSLQIMQRGIIRLSIDCLIHARLRKVQTDLTVVNLNQTI